MCVHRSKDVYSSAHFMAGREFFPALVYSGDYCLAEIDLAIESSSDSLNYMVLRILRCLCSLQGLFRSVTLMKLQCLVLKSFAIREVVGTVSLFDWCRMSFAFSFLGLCGTTNKKGDGQPLPLPNVVSRLYVDVDVEGEQDLSAL